MSTNTLTISGTVNDSTGNTAVSMTTVNATAPGGARTNLAANGTTNFVAPTNAVAALIGSNLTAGATLTINGATAPLVSNGLIPINAGQTLTVIIASFMGGTVEVVFV